MREQDDNFLDKRLHVYLQQLERGASLERVIASVPPEEAELIALIRMAHRVRTTPHPEPSLEHKHNLYQQVLREAQEMKNSNPRPTQPFRPKALGRRAWLLFPAVGALAVLFVGLMAGIFALGRWLDETPADAMAATVTGLTGQVEVASSATSSDWRALAAGDQVTAGQRVRAQAGSTATLQFFEGTRASLEPGSDVILSRVDGDRRKTLRVVLIQMAGKTGHDVVPLRGSGGTYLVFTPNSAASVQGTKFSVDVLEQDASRFAVDKGRVLVSSDGEQVTLTAGQVTSAEGDGELASPSYRFTLSGTITSSQGSTWIISGVPVTVLDGTRYTGSPQVGDAVVVDGRVLDTGEWVADSIVVTDKTEHESNFTGVLESIDGSTWVVSGWSVVVTDDTHTARGLKEGVAVRVRFTLMDDGRWLATSIVPLEQEDDDATPPGPDAQAEPVLEFVPSELTASGCESDFSVSGTLRNTASQAEDQAANIELGYQVTLGAEYVSAVSLNPNAWSALAAGESANFSVQIQLDEAAWKAAPLGTEVKVRVIVDREGGEAGGHPGGLIVNVVKNCMDETLPIITPPAVVTGTVPVTVTPSITGTLPAVPPGEVMGTTLTGDCTGAQLHPTGSKLADYFEVPYDEIMYWFCERGFGFGEIYDGYYIARNATPPVMDVGVVFGLRDQGWGWGEIKQYYNVWPDGKNDMKLDKQDKKDKQDNPNKPDKEPNPNKPDDPGNKDKDKKK